ISTDSSVLDLDIDDVEQSDTESQDETTLNQHLTTEKEGSGKTSRMITPPKTPRLINETPPKTAGSTITVFSSVLPGRGKNLLSEAGLGVNRIMAVPPTIPQNQYWMLPGAVFDD
ncbi:hypothetical protein SK128_003253, partial [Halocaridina rubra]